MFARLRSRRPSHATVVAYLALFVALGGTSAYAANTIFSTDIVDGQVKNADIGSNQITTAKIYPGSVTKTDVHADAVDSTKVLNNEIRSEDVRDDTLAGGGLTGADLAEDSVGYNELQFGVLGLHTRQLSAATALDTTAAKELQVGCPLSNEEVTGGGFVIAGTDGTNVPSVVVQRSYAVDQKTWLVRAIAATGSPWQLTVIANCIQ
jgi:hypothetical protein